MRLRLIFYLLHSISLIIGSLIYILFRSGNILIFKWFKFLGIAKFIDYIRKFTLHFAFSLPKWFLFSFPDGLFLFSYVTLMLSIWNFKVNYISGFWIFIIPWYFIGTEIGQLFSFYSGTFDKMDMFFYFLSLFISYFLYYIVVNKITVLNNLKVENWRVGFNWIIIEKENKF